MYISAGFYKVVGLLQYAVGQSGSQFLLKSARPEGIKFDILMKHLVWYRQGECLKQSIMERNIENRIRLRPILTVGSILKK